MQAFLVLPAFGLVYLVAAPTGLRRRIAQTLAGVAAIVVSCGWWVAIVALWPAGSRPFIDGSPDNNIFNLIFGYNGLGRIFASSAQGGAGGGQMFSGATGLLRLFDSEMGAQASWLLPAALLSLIVGLWWRRRAPRTDRTRAALLLWGGWLLVSGLVFSLGSGVIHTYYTVALAPAIAALIAIAGSIVWKSRHTLAARATVALAVIVTAGWSWVLLDRTPQWEAWLRVLIPASAAIAVIGLLAAPALRRLGRRASIATAVLAVVACLSGPLAYSAQTIATAHTGSIPSAGPGSSTPGGGPGGAPGGRGGSAFGGRGLPGGAAGGQRPGSPANGAGAGGLQLFGSSGAHGDGASATATRAGGFPARGAGRSAAGGGPGGAQSVVGAALKKALESGASSFRWVAAVSGSQTAASLELATGGEPVMAIGGFNNEGGHLTLTAFERYVAHGDIHYYFASGGAGGGPGGAGGPGGGASSTASITSWVEAHFKPVKIGGETVYDLTQPLD
jgi:hypothetical protein